MTWTWTWNELTNNDIESRDQFLCCIANVRAVHIHTYMYILYTLLMSTATESPHTTFRDSLVVAVSSELRLSRFGCVAENFLSTRANLTFRAALRHYATDAQTTDTGLVSPIHFRSLPASTGACNYCICSFCYENFSCKHAKHHDCCIFAVVPRQDVKKISSIRLRWCPPPAPDPSVLRCDLCHERLQVLAPGYNNNNLHEATKETMQFLRQVLQYVNEKHEKQPQRGRNTW